MAKPKRIGVYLSAKDKNASVTLRNISARFQKLSKPVNKLNYAFLRNKKALSGVINSLKKVESGFTQLGKKMTFGVSAPIAAVAGATAKVSAGFEQSMIKVKSLTRASSDEFSQLNAMARDLGKSSQFSASQAADAMGYLSMAGFDTNKIMAATPGMLDLAAASQVDLGDAADYASNILTSFGKEASEIEDVSDKLTYAFSNSNTTLSDLNESLVKSGSAALMTGASFEHVLAMVMQLGNAGIKEGAGLAVAQSLARVSRDALAGLDTGQGNEVSKTLAKLKIDLKTILHIEGEHKGKFKISPIEFMEILDDKKAIIGDYTRIFGGEHGLKMMALSGKDAIKGLKKNFAGLSGIIPGLTKKIATEYQAGATGGFKILLSSLQELMLSIGDTGFLDILNTAARTLADMFVRLSEVSKGTKIFVGALAALLFLLGPLNLAVGLIAKAGLFLAGSSALAATSAGSIGLPVMAGVAATAVGATAAFSLYDNWDSIKDSVKGWFGLDIPERLNTNQMVSESLLPDLSWLIGTYERKFSPVPMRLDEYPKFQKKAYPFAYQVDQKQPDPNSVDGSILGSIDSWFKEKANHAYEKQQKESLDINISLSGNQSDAKVETRNKSKARVKLDTGRIALGV